jgi:hypothetical protein
VLSWAWKLSRGVLVLQQFSQSSSGGGADEALLGGRGELGGAIAAVEAAGRTVLISTKQVVSAVAGTLNITETREEAYDPFGFDSHDAIILAEVIHKAPGEDTLVVVRPSW